MRLEPLRACRDALSLLSDQYLWPLIGWSTIVEDVSPEPATEGGLLLTNRVSGDLPFYPTEWFSVVVLLAWLVAPVAVGYRRFSRTSTDAFPSIPLALLLRPVRPLSSFRRPSGHLCSDPGAVLRPARGRRGAATTNYNDRLARIVHEPRQ